MKNTNSLTEGKILKPLIAFALPVLGSLFRIGLATPAATICQVIACLIYFKACKKEEMIR